MNVADQKLVGPEGLVLLWENRRKHILHEESVAAHKGQYERAARASAAAHTLLECIREVESLVKTGDL